MKWRHAWDLGASAQFRNASKALFRDPGATLNDLHEAVTTLEEIERNAWRLLGGAHPLRLAIEDDLKAARLAAALRAREIS